ncbi:MarR family transcriptional regulator [Ramlibacter tataouinensis]|uniref:MarR family winged helix-turn-helix transcriptional regulator n=1 Tax=Ramlibacter tataouinensis TaxID=94132 RepID=UPI0022F3B995|nr:MarR family transcriptional regulator [Ramlibacter tataouinensis]WBY03944.1 MarR family transcriptional regulator [Ramlibacter tataouinensis]
MHGSRTTVVKQDFEALAEFRYRLRQFLRFSEEVTLRHGVTPLQYQLLLQLKGYPGRSHASIAELAERLQSKHHGVVALVTRCEELGLVRRKPSEQDLRQVEVHLTAAGERSVANLARLHGDELRQLAALLRGIGDFQTNAEA